VAAHWRYKEGGRASRSAQADEARVAWLRQLLAWRAEVGPAPALGGEAEERTYVLTPQGRVVELPAGATPVDFAYHIHTELGHRCRGARVDGVMVPLDRPLATGQTVEIISAKTGGPSRDWLMPSLGFVHSARSRAKVRNWFNALEHESSVAAGRLIVDRELARLGRTAVKLDELARQLGFTSVEELCVAATREEFSARSIEHVLTEAPTAPEEKLPPLLSGTAGAHHRPAAAASGKGRVLVVGVDALLTQLARCCRPLPPDEIIGFVTRGKGVSIHRSHCANALGLAKRQPERLIEVSWGASDASYPVDVFVLANDRSGLLRDISEVLAREKLNVIGVNTVSVRHEAQMQFTLEVADGGTLRRVLAQINDVKGVVSARRR
jgi:GTP pyrophosphokinase